MVVSAEIAQAHHFLIQVSVLLGINWPLYQATHNSPNIFNEGNIFEIFPSIVSLFQQSNIFSCSLFSILRQRWENMKKIIIKPMQRKPFSEEGSQSKQAQGN